MDNPEHVLLDTSALYALISRTDEFHPRAQATYQDLLAGGARLWITSYVLVEFGALVHHRLGFEPIRSFVEATQDVYETLWIDSELHSQAWVQFETRKGEGLNFVDWTTLMSARRIGATIFTFDSGFDREGAEVVKMSA